MWSILEKRGDNMVIIQKAKEEDLQEILNLQYLAYQGEARLFNNSDIPPLKQILPDLVDEFQKGVVLKVLNESGAIIGSVRGYCKDGTVHIGKLIVSPIEQGKGIGTKLLLEMEKEYPKQRYELFTSTKSKRNIALYQRLGYKIFKEKKITEELRFVFLEKRS